MSGAETATGRVAHITLPKCGSQWVRDVLTDREVSRASGFHLEAADRHEFVASWEGRAQSSFVGPIYNAPYATWAKRSAPGDRAVVVLRDPRDQIVSWVYSLCYTHETTPGTRIFRELLLTLDDRAKLALLCEHWRTFYGVFRSYSNAGAKRDPSVFLTSYERLSSASFDGYAEILTFLGWELAPDALRRVVERHSFGAKTGRRPGQEDTGSHLRKGTPGDWKHYFDRSTGKFFERRYAGLLGDLGYETEPRWYESLPEEPRRSFSRS